MNRLVRVFLGFLIVPFLVFSAAAHEMTHGDLVIAHAVIPATVKAAPVAAGYLEITNKGDKPERLISVSTGFSIKSQIHTMEMVEGVMKMRPVKDGIEIKPGETVVLEKGGLHLMFMKLQEQMEKGQSRKVTLVFENAGEIDIDMMVMDPAKLGEHSTHSH